MSCAAKKAAGASAVPAAAAAAKAVKNHKVFPCGLYSKTEENSPLLLFYGTNSDIFRKTVDIQNFFAIMPIVNQLHDSGIKSETA